MKSRKIKINHTILAVACLAVMTPGIAKADVDGWGIFTEEECNMVWDEYTLPPLVWQNNISYQIVSVDPPEAMVVYQHNGMADCLPYPESYEIPASVSFKGVDYKIIGIDSFCFSAGSKSVLLPESLIFIGNRGIYSLESEKVIIPSGIKFIGSQNFSGMKNVTALSIPASVLTIGNHSFTDNRKVKELTINEGLVSIGDDCFNNYYGIEELVLPMSLREIGKDSFNELHQLRKVKIPRWLSEYPEGCFNGCYNLREIELTDPYNVWLPTSWFTDVSKDLCVIIIPDATKDDIIPDNGFRYVRKSEWESGKDGDSSITNTQYPIMEDGIYTLSGLKLENIDALRIGDCYVSVSDGKASKLIR